MNLNQRFCNHFNIKTTLITALMLCLLMLGQTSWAWSPDGHSAIGVLAMKQLSPTAKSRLESIIGPITDEAMIEACNWPDDIRETEQWKWSAPQHYINIPRGETDYDQERDCADKLCATEAIKNYSMALFDNSRDKEERWQAFAWLCHVTGDLHQPMHAGFADDRGANNVQVSFRGEEMNLHSFWDFSLVNSYAGGWRAMVELLSTEPLGTAVDDFVPDMVNEWTRESHALATNKAYPHFPMIDENFALRSWILAQQQVSLAATRLASIINTYTASDK